MHREKNILILPIIARILIEIRNAFNLDCQHIIYYTSSTHTRRSRAIYNSLQYTNTRMLIVCIQYTRTLLIRNTL